MANVRFDVKLEEQINYTNDTSNFSTSINSHLPDPSLGFANDSTGSDVLNVIEKFLNNSQTPICGSSVFILLKRNPDVIQTNEIVRKLQENHVFVRTIGMNSLLGGSVSPILYNISSETNGLFIYADSDSIDESVDDCTNNILNQYLLYSTNPIVSGKGQMELPLLQTPDYFEQTLSVFIDITVQNHPLTDNFHLLNLTLTDTHENYQTVLIDKDNIWNFNGYYSTFIFLKSKQDFDVTLTYDYGSAAQESLEIRMSINQAIPNWPPYGN
uniref:Cadherin domain-containing protein n=1 Tax=Caenorhabditis tropicalis TaxID=1561998 RepID=A0A1I7T462_9PELO